jgi:alpha-tubulin suppressor-like RCC1 family protein
MLHCAGSNACGQLGLPGDDRSIPTPSSLPFGKEIQLDGGANHSLAVVDGVLYGSGSNRQGQLGLDNDEYPVFIELHKNVEWISCGWNCSFLSSNGIFATGENTFGQLGTGSDTIVPEWKKIDLENVVKIRCGMRHTLFLCENGDLYGTGMGKQGALGVIQSTLVPMLMTRNVQDIACGQFHSVYLQEGHVYILGRNKFKLLLSDIPFSVEPVWIPLPVPIIKVVSGWHTVCVQAADGRVFSWGRNDRGQAATVGEVLEPKEIELLNGCSDIVYGSEHALARMPDDRVYVWGWNEHGNLGIGTQNDVLCPVLLSETYRMIGSGAGHTLLYK